MNFKRLLTIFFIWRIWLFVILLLIIPILPLQKDFLGGGISNYLSNPWIFSWLNFDGAHYLSIAIQGYRPLTYFYFPLYPLVSKYLAIMFGGNFYDYVSSGLLISHLAFFIGLIGIVRIFILDYKEKIVKRVILLIFLFPTSYYFAGFYTESLFFALAVWTFYFARKRKWMLAGILTGLATATRIVGLALIPVLLIEAMEIRSLSDVKLKFNFKNGTTDKLFGILLSFSGITLYMLYLGYKTNDPFAFFNNLSIFGEQRQSGFVLLPQVFYRYIFKVIPAIDYNYFPVIFSTYLEFITSLIYLLLAILSTMKLRLSYSLYLIISYLIPTFSGSFSSLPRYVLIAFPAFLLISLYFDKLSKNQRRLSYFILAVLQIISVSLFVRGYWIS